MELKLENITFGYNKWQEALAGVSVDFGAGLHLLLGPNGAGKSTLFQVVAGLLAPQSGECVLGTENTVYHSPHAIKEIFLLTDECRFPLATINEMVRLHAPFYPDFSADFLAEALAAFGQTGDEKLKELSLGNRRKAQIAYALALRTKVLMLDEPANGLDINAKKALTHIISRAMAADEDRCIIIATHTVQEMRNLFDSVTIINAGRVVLSESVARITERLAFINDTTMHADAVYFEPSLEGPSQIVPNTDGVETPVDFSLLYSAAVGQGGDRLKAIFND